LFVKYQLFTAIPAT